MSSASSWQPFLPGANQLAVSTSPRLICNSCSTHGPGAVPSSPLKRARTQEDAPVVVGHPVQLQPQNPSQLPQFSHAAAGNGSPDLGRALKAVFKVYATIASPNYALPWQMHAQTKSTATAFAIHPISSRRILTNAHAVANQIQVQLRKHGSARKFPARVVAVGHECDLAMLTVDDDAFWQDVQGLQVAQALPAMQESVSVVGYPTGGDNVCVTKGVVSRVDRQQYSHGRTSLLALQIDAAINSGNSGGPVIKAGSEVIGIAFQCLTAGENVGYVIPGLVVNHFLNDLARHGKYTGFCDLGASWQTLESSDHKAALGLAPGTHGVYVTAVEPCYPASLALKPGDVITSFNGHPVADDGTFLFEPHHAHNPRNVGHTGALALGSSPSINSNCSSGGAMALEPADSMRQGQLIAATCSNCGGPTASSDEPCSVDDARQNCHETSGPQPCAAASSAVVVRAPSAVPAVLPSAPNGTMVALGPGGEAHTAASRIDFRHLVAMHYEGDQCQLGVWRDGAPVPGGLTVTLTTPKQLVPVHSHDEKPWYFIFGGLVFTRLTAFYLRSAYGADWTTRAPIKLCDRAFAGYLEGEGQECVILSKVLAWDVNTGYQDWGNTEVLRACGVRVHNLAHLAHLLIHAPGPFVKIDLQWNKVIMMSKEKAVKAGSDILSQNSIPSPAFPTDLTKMTLSLPESVYEATRKALGDALPSCITKQPTLAAVMGKPQEQIPSRPSSPTPSLSSSASATMLDGSAPATSAAAPAKPSTGMTSSFASFSSLVNAASAPAAGEMTTCSTLYEFADRFSELSCSDGGAAEGAAPEAAAGSAGNSHQGMPRAHSASRL